MVTWYLSGLNGTNASTQTNRSVNAHTYEAALCAALGFSCVCGGFGNGPYTWATHPDSWRMKGQHALAVLTVLFSPHNKTAAYQWSFMAALNEKF